MYKVARTLFQTFLQKWTVLIIKNLLKTQLLKPITQKITSVLTHTRASGPNHKYTTTLGGPPPPLNLPLYIPCPQSSGVGVFLKDFISEPFNQDEQFCYLQILIGCVLGDDGRGGRGPPNQFWLLKRAL